MSPIIAAIRFAAIKNERKNSSNGGGFIVANLKQRED